MKKLLKILSSVSLLMALSGCYYDNRAELLAQNPADDCNTDTVTFSNDINPIIQSNCAVSGCHNATTQAAGLNYEEFADLKSVAGNGNLVGRITATGTALMPQGGPPLPDCQINKIRAWVQDGAPQN